MGLQVLNTYIRKVFIHNKNPRKRTTIDINLGNYCKNLNLNLM